MNYTARDQMIRIAGFSLFLGAAALMAQSPNGNPLESAKVQLVASIATPSHGYPGATELLQNSQPQASSSSMPTQFVRPGSTSEAHTTSPAVPLVNPVLMTTKLLPGTAKLAMVNGHSAPTQPSWFTAGPHAVPVAVRMDPAFGPPTSTYGAAPMAVQFTFGRK